MQIFGVKVQAYIEPAHGYDFKGWSHDGENVAEAAGNAAENAAEAVGSAVENAKSGCGSFIGGGLIVLVSVLGSAWIAKRK